jgi:hypothetical protein
MDNVVDNLLEERNIEAIEKEKQRLLSLLKNKEITTTEYIKKIENSNFSYKNVAFDDTGRRTIFSGRINNNSGKDYRSATFNLIVFDKGSFEYKRAGTFVINDFFAGDASEFETSIMIQSRDIADYYIEFAGGEERRKEREIEKKKKGKKIIELKMELN